MPTMTPGQQELFQKLVEFTIRGNGDAEEIGRIIGRLVEVLPKEDRQALERGVVVHRATLILELLAGLGYVPGPR